MRTRLATLVPALLALAVGLVARPVAAQTPDARDTPVTSSGCLAPLPAPAPLGGDAALHRTYTRGDSTARFAGCDQDTLRVIPWSARLISRSGVPDVRGNGGAPTTIGSTLHLRAGIELRLGRVQLRLAPEIVAASNGDFLTFPGRDSTRSSFASPFYYGDFSADLPLRPGTASYLRVDPGESGAWFIVPNFALSATTGLPDWGPGIGEGLVLGRSTAGLPRVELDASRALGAARVRLRWFGGTAVEGRFFDVDRENDLRSVAGARVTYERANGAFIIGASRTVMDGRRGGPMRAALQPLLATRTDSLMELLAVDLLFANAARGSYAWLEATRQLPLRSFRDLTLMPTEGLAFRVGMSQRLIETERARWILGLEAVRLDQPPQRSGRDPQDLYTSPTVVQGWTHRGQPLGSGLGPGGQRQYLALDREGRTWRLGGFLERVRWNDDALYREFLAYQNRHDVSVQLGLRAGRTLRSGKVMDVLLSGGQRLNYLFQNGTFIPGYRTSDVGFVHLTVVLQ